MTDRKRAELGFTLIELMIVVAVIAIVATIALPNLVSARILSNETAVVANLKSIWTGQAQFQSSATCDLDNDGIGEFGFFRELTAAQGVRTAADGSTTGNRVNFAPVSVAFGNLDVNGASQRTGYSYIMLLPSATGAGVHETAAGAFTGAIDPDLAEVAFCVYAWPIGYAASGTRSFFVNLSGDVLTTDWDAYSGNNFHAATVDGAAFTFGTGPSDSITGDPAMGTYGRDLNWWRPVR